MTAGDKEKARLLVLVCSCQGYQDRNIKSADSAGCKAKRAACRETWLADMPPGVSYAFFVGGAQPQGEPDVWALNAPDTYHGLPEKVRAAFVRALTVPGWKWLFKCDDDTYCVLPRLLQMADSLTPAPAVISWPGNEKDTAHGGAGYLLPRAMVQAIVADKNYNTKGIDHEDKQVTYSVRRAGGCRIGDERLHAFMQRIPTPQNNQISCHYATPADMRRIHTAWEPGGQDEEKAEENLPPWLAAQGSRELPAARPKKRESKEKSAIALADGLNIPRGTRRIVIFSNVTRDFDPRALPLKPGDHCIHINRARQFFKVFDTPGVTHALVVRKGTERENGRIKWYAPPTRDGFTQVLHIADVPMRARRAWWREYCQRNARQCPTSGFICWQLAREAAPMLPVVLAGFAPGEQFGTPQWRGHAWAFEAEEYARAGAHIVRPDAPGMAGNLPRVKWLVMVRTSMQHEARRNAVRATWAKNVPEGVAVHFYCGAKDAPHAADENSPDMVRLPGISHAQGAQPAAHIEMMRWALKNYNFSYLFKCDDDTFTALDRLASYTPPQSAAMIGNPDPIKSAVALSGGAGYIIHRGWVERLVFNPGPQPWKIDDVYISQEVQRLGGVLMPERRFYHPHDKVPAPGNRQITAHWCKPADMWAIMEGLTK